MPRRESSLHRETLHNIQLAPSDKRQCACAKQSDGRWFLCAYHEGFDDGVDAGKASVPSQIKDAVDEWNAWWASASRP